MSELNVVELLTSGELHSFHGGIHPLTEKKRSNQAPLQRLPLPEKLYVPLRQHLGDQGTLCVNKGDYVYKGQPLTYADSPRCVPVHAPTSGTISALRQHPSAHPSAMPEPIAEITPDGADQWRTQAPCDEPLQQDSTWLYERIRHAGIAGMGGAGFPTLVKLTPRQPVQALIINGAECEPYITADDRLMRERSADIITGIQIIRRLLNEPTAIIAIEDDKPEAIAAMRTAARGTPITVQAIPVKYPSGGERQLIQILTGLEVPAGDIPASLGIVVQNIGTAYAVKRAVVDDEPVLERVVTLTGRAVKQPGNYWVLTGTPVHALMEHVCKKTPKRVIMGGPMMGFELASLDIPVIKTSNCLIAPGKRELNTSWREQPCIRCSACADACPAQLLPQQLLWFAKSKEYDKLTAHNLFDCIECGICAYVCPSEIPLVQYYRQSKATIRQQQQEKAKSDHARARFEARKARLEKEKAERKVRHNQAASSTTHAASTPASEARSAVAAAVERAKARQQSTDQSEDMAAARAARKEQARQAKAAKNTSSNDQQDNTDHDKVAAAIARAKAKRQAQTQPTTAEAEPTSSASSVSAEDKKDKVAAAIARAKAKRQAAQQAATTTSEQTPPVTAPAPSADQEAEISAPVDDKKAKVAAAIARAKAKKQAAAQATTAPEQEKTTPEPEHADDAASEADASATAPADDKKAKVAAAIARAKAKKQAAAQAATTPAQEKSTPEPEHEDDAASEADVSAAAPADDKKAKVAAAIARAKAKKQAAAQAATTPAQEKTAPEPEHADDAASEADASATAPADDKKAKVAAAIARAKAKKRASAQHPDADNDSSKE